MASDHCPSVCESSEERGGEAGLQELQRKKVSQHQRKDAKQQRAAERMFGLPPNSLVFGTWEKQQALYETPVLGREQRFS